MGGRTCVALARRLLSLTLGAEDGIRTRDPHLGKVAVFVHGVLSSPLACCYVRPVSTQSTGFAPVVERSTTKGDEWSMVHVTGRALSSPSSSRSGWFQAFDSQEIPKNLRSLSNPRIAWGPHRPHRP
jgi:hypothetical protein